MSQTEAQAEFQQLVDQNGRGPEDDRHLHPEDRLAQRKDSLDDLDEEEQHRAAQIDAAMRMRSVSHGDGHKLPPASFDSGRATGVKGVIADARNYELARKATLMSRVRTARRSVFGLGGLGGGGSDKSPGKKSEHSSSSDDDDDDDEASFLAQWRESRRRELEDDARPGAHIRTRRTSPSVRLYGRFDTVDALGYLDAIEKVGRETVVLVFVYDDECQVSSAVESALRPLVSAHPAVHFVKVHYDDIEFDNAAVPAILAYRNQGDLFANLTGLIEMLDDGDGDDVFGRDSIEKLLRSKDIL